MINHIIWWWRTRRARKHPEWYVGECNCSAHDITTPGAAHAVDCPQYD